MNTAPLAVVIIAAVLTVTAGDPAAAASAAAADFDGDGRDEFVAADVSAWVNGPGYAGAFSVIYGETTGISTRDQRWHRNTRGIKGIAVGSRDGEQDCCHGGFARNLTSGDFDGDGYGDVVATHSGNEKTAKYPAAPPTFSVLYGSPTGTSAHDDLWSLGSRAVKGRTSGSFDFETPVTGDFDGDGFDDLLFTAMSGHVHVMAGSAAGLSGRDVRLSRATPGVAGRGRFGWLYDPAVGDFDGDGRDDVAVPAYAEPGRFEFTVFYGGRRLLTAERSQRWTPSSAGLTWRTRMFGSRLSAGDVDGDGDDDLVVFAEQERADDVLKMVLVAPGSPRGVTAGGWQELSLETPGMAVIEPQAGLFGTDLEVGDADGDGFADIVVGAIEARDHDKSYAVGGLYVIPGSPAGPDAQASSSLTPQNLGLHDGADSSSGMAAPYFYRGLLFRDYDGDGYDDLTVMTMSAPAVVVYGSSAGPDRRRVELWSSQTRGIRGDDGWRNMPAR